MGAGWCRAAACARGDSARSAGGVGMVDRLGARRFLVVRVAVLGLGLVGRWRWTTGYLQDTVDGAGGGCGLLSPVGCPSGGSALMAMTIWSWHSEWGLERVRGSSGEVFGGNLGNKFGQNTI